MFTTARLILRAYEPSDDDKILKMWDDPILQSCYTTSLRIIPPHGQTFTSWVNTALSHAIIIVAATGEFVGTCSLWLDSGPKNRDAQLNITIERRYWNMGYGTEALVWMRDHAFRDLALHRVSLGLYANNKRALRTYQKVSVSSVHSDVIEVWKAADSKSVFSGFVEEARVRKASWVNGRWEDILRMGMLEEDWNALQAAERPVV